MGKLIVDSDIRALNRKLTADERRELKASLKRDGCRDAVVAWEGKILDGHNRHELCEELGIGYRVVEMEFDTKESAMAWARQNQRARRNLSPTEYANLAMDAAEAIGTRGGDQKSQIAQETAQKSNGQMADRSDESGPSERTIGRAAVVVKKGTPALKRAVRSGKVSIPKAEKIARLPKTEQKEAIDMAQFGITDDGDAEKQAAEPAPTDELGQEIPEKQRPAFASRAVFDEALGLLTQIAKLINPLAADPAKSKKAAPGGDRLNRQEIRLHGKNLRSQISFARPYALCPYPHGRTECQACRGTGWVTETAYENAPREMKKGAKK